MRNRKRYSQNFLRSPSLASEILQLGGADLLDHPSVVEIGPGDGVITSHLVDQLGLDTNLFAVEIDPFYAGRLAQQFKGQGKLKVINDCILNYPLPKENFSVVSNLPYHCTSQIMSKLLDPTTSMESALLVIQKEAAEMYMGKEGKTFKSLLSFPFWEFQIVHRFDQSDFDPRPGVDSVLLKINRKSNPLINVNEFESYSQFLKLVSRDRVSEGIWRKMFTKKQLANMTKNSGLVKRRGISYQPERGVVDAYGVWCKYEKVQQSVE